MIKFTYLHKLTAEGAGSLLQRELFAYFASEIMGYEFIGINNKFLIGHEPDHITQEKLNSDWGLLRQCIANYIDADLILEEDVIDVKTFNSLSQAIIDYKFVDKVFFLSIDFKIAHELYKKQSNYTKQKLVDDIRIKFKAKFDFGTDEVFALHIRCASKADEVFGFETLPWQHFNKDYGIHNNNPEFYRRLYNGILKGIVENYPISIRPKLNIYSTCTSGDLDLFCINLKSTFDIKIILNGYSFDDFISLSRAKILISAHSSFSWLALFFNSNDTFIRSGFRHELPYNTTIFNDRIANDYCYRDLFLTWITGISFFMRKNYLKLKGKL